MIDRLAAIVRVERASVLVGIGDDAAVVSAPGAPLVLTCDAVVEGVHFERAWSEPEAIGWRAVTASVSDVAAMGARPQHVLLTLAVSRNTEVDWLERVYRGIRAACDAYDVAVVGGDVVSTAGPMLLGVTVTGEQCGAHPLLRSTARPGDAVFVTGDLGGCGAFVHRRSTRPAVVLAPEDEQALYDRYAHPVAQVQAMIALTEAGWVACANDISDGLGSELHEIADASGVHVVIEAARIPTPPALRHYAKQVGISALDFALAGGEDYQIVGTVGRDQAGLLLARLEAIGVRATLVGQVFEGDPGVTMTLLDGKQRALERRGYDHFERGADGR
ncbi:MAG: thiamine-phosphate kinase [Firmicutes bacterium]|nr:thiamine-phosphate kinase [Bacillota bacterium]